jgi:poly(A) polymerase
MRPMIEPRVIPRAEHSISRRDIDPDALKVLYRLRQFDYIAYLVGGSVRDLLLGRRPKDFDIGTSAHPYQIKKLFRNCWIIGRRFRLAHVKFGPKVIEVATFRRQLQPGEEVTQEPPAVQEPGALPTGRGAHHHDNTFGTPEEDAFRRDFTINALFYDIATFSIIDYVNGMDDLRAGIVRSIGDPSLRFQEDPVRMLRAVALATRLGFTIDPPIAGAIATHRHEIARSSPARLLEECYKILRGGYAERTMRALAEAGLLEVIAPELHRADGDPLWRSLAALDAYRAKFTSVPDAFTNPILLGTLLVPLGFSPFGDRRADRAPADGPGSGHTARPAGARLGELPVARRDLERLSQIVSLQRRLRDTAAGDRARRTLARRQIFREAVTWLEIHGGSPELAERWRTVLAEPSGDAADVTGHEPAMPRRRRRRRRNRYRPAPV